MAKLEIQKATTNVTVYIFIQDSTATDGSGLTGLVFNSAGLTCYYVRPLAAAAALSLATQTVTGAHSDGGFVEVDATNMPGIYRLDLSDAICATGVNSVVVMLKGATDMAPVTLEIQLVSYDPNDAVRLGLTALPNAAAGAAGGLPTDSTGKTSFNDLSAAAVNAEVDTALTDIHLDHLLAADYDPASKPGTATALLNELVESDGGVSRFTTNALEQAPGSATTPASVWDLADGVETGMTPRQALRVIASATAGKSAGLDTTTATYQNAQVGSKDRITATVDQYGNRTAVTLDMT